MINLNGQLHPSEHPLFTTTNRAFRYGDGLFESIRVFEGKMPFFERHWQRLSAGMRILKFERPANYSPAFFYDEISKLTREKGNWRLRLTVFRSGGGLYTPERNVPAFLIEATPLAVDRFELNAPGLRIGVFDEIRLSTPLFSTTPNAGVTPSHADTSAFSLHPHNFKTCNALPFVLAGIFIKENGWDDCLLLNTAGRVACASSSNVFTVKNGILNTPPLFEGCVAGTMRGAVLEEAKTWGIDVWEEVLSIETILDADEIFLTNAIQGVRWVQKIARRGRELHCGFSERMVAALNAGVDGF